MWVITNSATPAWAAILAASPALEWPRLLASFWSLSVQKASWINNRAPWDASATLGLKRVSPENTTDTPLDSIFQPTAPGMWSAGNVLARVVGPRVIHCSFSTAVQRKNGLPSAK